MADAPVAGTMVGGGSFDNLSPEQVQQLMGLGSMDERQALLLQQMKTAQALRDTPMPKGTVVGSRNWYVAPHPLQIAADTALKYKGYQDQAAAQAAMEKLADKQDVGRRAFFDWYKSQFGKMHPSDPDATSDASVSASAPVQGEM